MNERKCYETDDCDQRDLQVNFPGPETPLIIAGGMHDDQEESTGQLLGDVLDLVDRATDYLTPYQIEDRLRQVLGSASAASDERPPGTGPLTEHGVGPLGEDRSAPDEPMCLRGQENASAADSPARGVLPEWSGGNCTVLITDITGFSAPSRTDADRRQVREAMYRLLDEAFAASGLVLADFYQEDRGDGALIVIPPTTPTEAVVDPMLAHLAAALRRHNRRAAEATRMQLRAALHVGPVQAGPNGVSGISVITASRMVDAPAVRKRVAETGAALAFVASDFVYDTVITSQPGFVDPGSYAHVRARPKEPSPSASRNADDASSGYERVQIGVKNSEATGWIRLIAARSQEPELSPEQTQLLSLIAQGITADQAARRLGGSARGLRRRLRDICDQLDVDTPLEAVGWAARHRLLEPAAPSATEPAHETTQDCADILTMVDLYLDDELDDAAMSVLRDHLDECPHCLREYGLHQALLTKIAQVGGGDPAPADLHGKILSRLAQLGADEGTKPPSERVRIGGGWEASSP